MADIGEMVKHYVSLRAELDAQRKEYQAIEKSLKAEMDKIMLEVMTLADNIGVDNFKTPYGTAYRNIKQSYKVDDWDTYVQWAKNHDALHTIQKRVTKTAVDEIVEETGEIPPGLDLFTEVTFNFMKGK